MPKNDVLECDFAPGPNDGKDAADAQEQKVKHPSGYPRKSVGPLWLSRVGHTFAAPQAEFMHYYNHDRPHRTLSLQTQLPYSNPGHGPVVSTSVLGGLHHAYARAA